MPAYNHSFVSIIQNYECKQVLVSFLDAEKMVEVVLLNVFRIGFPASLLLSNVNYPDDVEGFTPKSLFANWV